MPLEGSVPAIATVAAAGLPTLPSFSVGHHPSTCAASPPARTPPRLMSPAPTSPAAQMAVALLIMFSSYALQVRYSPYMSPSEHTEIVAHHERMALAGHRMHVLLASRVREVLARGKKKSSGDRAGVSKKLGRWG